MIFGDDHRHGKDTSISTGLNFTGKDIFVISYGSDFICEPDLVKLVYLSM